MAILRGGLRISIAGMMSGLIAIAVGFTSLRFASETWAGVILLITLTTLSLAVLGVTYREGARRAGWLGFALLGWGYMVLVSGAWWDRGVNRPELITTMILDRASPHLLLSPGQTPGSMTGSLSRLFAGSDPRDELILAKLDVPIAMPFSTAAPLEDVLKYIKSASQGPKDNGIPIYVDPVGLKEAKAKMNSRVALDVQGVPLRTSLAMALRQLGLTYVVRDGLLTITKGAFGGDVADHYRRIGHCYWALLAGWIGAFAGRYFYHTRDESRGVIAAH